MMASAHGLFRATAVDVRDPEQRMRVLVSVPQVLGEDPGGPRRARHQGAHSVPSTGQPVWVMFERGNPDAPVCSGLLLPPSSLSTDQAQSEARPQIGRRRGQGDGFTVTVAWAALELTVRPVPVLVALATAVLVLVPLRVW